MKGREIEEWNKKLANPLAAEKVKVIRTEGFAGIYIDTLGYPDKSIVTNFQTLLKTNPIISSNGRLAFFNLLSGPTQ